MGSIDDIMQLCRLCLVKDQVNIPIFDEASDIRQTFIKINSCLPVKVSQDDNLPKKICDGCSYKLDMLYIFRNTSVDSEKQLLSWLNQAGLGACSLPQSAVKDGGTKPEIMVKQETFESTDSRIEEENPEMCADAHSYIIQQQKLPYQQEFGFGEASGSTEMVVEEPAPKRAKRAAAMKKHVPIETDEDELDTAMQITKAEEDDSDDIDQPDYVEAPSTSADDQPGPSGVGKGAIEAPCFEEFVKCEKDEWYSSITVGGSLKEEEYTDKDPLEIIENVPDNVNKSANVGIDHLVPQKSRERYAKEFSLFEKWKCQKNVTYTDEKVVLAYFCEKSEKLKSSTLWSMYSMLRTEINIRENIDISGYVKLKAFLKQKAVGYKAKKSKTLTAVDIAKYLTEADDDTHLMIKVAVIFGVYGACRREELYNLSTDDIEDRNDILIVTIRNTRTNTPRVFAILRETSTINALDLYRKYLGLRPANIKHKHFFIYYRSGKCTPQRVGINTFAQLPRKVAMFLKLPNSELYTGHCFRRSSATLLADSGADITTLNRRRGWSSTCGAEGYIVESIEDKVNISRRITSVVACTTSSAEYSAVCKPVASSPTEVVKIEDSE